MPEVTARVMHCAMTLIKVESGREGFTNCRFDASFGQERALLMRRPRLVRAGSGTEVPLDLRRSLRNGSGLVVIGHETLRT